MKYTKYMNLYTKYMNLYMKYIIDLRFSFFSFFLKRCWKIRSAITQKVANKRMKNLQSMKSRLLWVMEVEHTLHMFGDKIKLLEMFQGYLPKSDEFLSEDKMKQFWTLANDPGVWLGNGAANTEKGERKNTKE
jgi:hypothetical protein